MGCYYGVILPPSCYCAGGMPTVFIVEYALYLRSSCYSMEEAFIIYYCYGMYCWKVLAETKLTSFSFCYCG